MAVEPRGTAVGSPSGMRDASVRIKDLCKVWLLLCNELLELDDLAHLLESKYFILLVAIYGEACRIVTAVLESGEA
jgi:hypothetical protein